MKHLFIDPLGFQGATLCGIILQVSTVTDPSVSAVLGYVDKLGTIGLLIYFLWRDNKNSKNREEQDEKKRAELKMQHQQELKAKDIFYEAQIQRIENFYTKNQNNVTGNRN